jgi:hypothetical protein
MTDSSHQTAKQVAVKDVRKNTMIKIGKEEVKDAVETARKKVAKEVVKDIFNNIGKKVVKEVANPNNIRMDTTEDAVDLIQKLYGKMYSTLQYMSSMTSKVNRFDRMTNQEMHIVSKLHRFLNESLMEIKRDPAAGEDLMSVCVVCVVLCVLCVVLCGVLWCVVWCVVVCCVLCYVIGVGCCSIQLQLRSSHFLASTTYLLLFSLSFSAF